MTNYVHTNKGTFRIRYAFYQQLKDCNVLVINDPKNLKPFTGYYGDEIPMMDTYKTQFQITVSNKK